MGATESVVTMLCHCDTWQIPPVYNLLLAASGQSPLHHIVKCSLCVEQTLASKSVFSPMRMQKGRDLQYPVPGNLDCD